MHILVMILAVAAVLYGPSLWASRVLKRNAKPREDIKGTGGEFARHLINRLRLDNVGLETTNQGDHYDPAAKTVRLSEANYNEKSLTAMVVAAHEVGHAMQDHLRYKPLTLRTHLAKAAYHAERAGALLIYAVPLIAALTRAPASGFAMLLLGIGVMAISSLVHFITLPVEFDASFNRALPVLRAGDYLAPADYARARKILLACALTYVANSLAGLLNIWRWITIFRR